MKSWVLILAAIAILLLVWGVRERFEGEIPRCPSGYARMDDIITPQREILCSRSVGEPRCPVGYTREPLVNTGPDSYSGGDCVKGNQRMRATCADEHESVYENGKVSCHEVKHVPLGPPSTAQSVDTSRTSGTTTGGTTGSTQGPNSGGGGDRRKQVFGPLFMGEGDGGVKGADSSKTNRYPQLLGGDGGKASTRIDGGGIVNPSGSGVTLPTPGSLGSNEDSKYLPFSREPGDMELIPDPYRVSQQFSSSSYSSKTEPVPFLTDFSAFQT